MNDSDQDFDLCSKLLKRVRKKPGEPKQARKAENQASSQTSDGDKRRRNNKKDVRSGSNCGAAVSETQSVSGETDQAVVGGGTGRTSGDAGSSVAAHSVLFATAGLKAERDHRAKDTVLNRMQQFKRTSPQKMVHKDKSKETGVENYRDPSPTLAEGQDAPQSSSSCLHLTPAESDEALALRLQQELDQEAAKAQLMDLEDGGLFFCQICQRDLSQMTPEGRTTHINRCLDESECHIIAPPPPGVPDCPICGKKFKSQKSRSTHLKRCSSDMGVSPAVLLQVVQRQVEETQSVAATNTLAQTGYTKKRGATRPGLPARKKRRKKTDPLDEDTMVALALSSSMLEQQKERLRDEEAERELQTVSAASHTSMLKWWPEAGKGRGKRRKGAIPRPPPLLLIQDAEVALRRLQERVSTLLLCSRAPSPPTPTRCPSSLPGWNGVAPLWRKSALLKEGSTGSSDFYAPELGEFITPWESATADSSSTNNMPDTPTPPVSEGTPVTEAPSSILPSSQTASCSPAPSSQGTGPLPVGSQALRDLMELAEDGMTLTQYGYTAAGPDTDKKGSLSTNLHLSGFVLEEAEEQADLCVSGFLPEAHTEGPSSQVARLTDQAGAAKQHSSLQSAALTRLASDLSSMVNNPQLSDLQLQVDSGEVFFAHSFMVYARCPLLAEMVHESAFGVHEEGLPAAQRVLVTDVPGQAVLALLQYLYTAQFSIPASLQPHVLELASRFDLQELQQLCELLRNEAAAHSDEGDCTSREEHLNDQTDHAFMDLLRSMWTEEDDQDEGTDAIGGGDEEGDLVRDQASDVTSGDREIHEEQVNEEELEEIYEFVATQRKRDEEKEIMEEKVDEEEYREVFPNLTEPKRSSRGLSEKNLQLNSEPDQDPSLDRSYNRLFSDSWGVYEEDVDLSSFHSTSPPPETHTFQSKLHQSPHTPSSKLSSRTLLQSSASVVDGHSLSPQASTSNLPIPGLSPDRLGDGGTEGDERTDTVEMEVPKESLSLKQKGKGPQIPDSPQNKKEPELIVLSDSSDDMEVAVLSSRSPSPFSPFAIQTRQSFTLIKPQNTTNTNEPTLEKTQSSSPKISPDYPSSAPAQSPPVSRGNQSPVDYSPEVSWLIPSTPVQPGRTNRTSSTQTKSSMCRTQLFPKGDASLSTSSVFSSPALPFENRPPTSNSPCRASTSIGPTEGSVPRLKLDGTLPCSSSGPVMMKDREVDSQVFAEAKLTYLSSSTHPFPMQDTSKQTTPLHLQHQPYSSTPLNTDVLRPPVPLAASPLYTGPDKQTPTSQEKDRAPSESPEKTELGSFHLSPLSDPSDPASCSSHRSPQKLQRHSKSSNQSQCSVESSRHNSTTKDGERERDLERKRTEDREQDEAKEGTGEADVAESSFHQSFMFMDEPPMAFNESWGLDACHNSPENPGRFSLRLEDSGGSSLQERSPGQRETAGSASPTTFKPATSSHLFQPVNSHEGVTTSAPFKSISSPPSTSGQTHAAPSSTPSPPGPATRTPPEISNSLLDSNLWDSWEAEEEEVLPLSWRVNPSAQLKTPTSSHNKKRPSLAPVTPMPHYSDMDTPELKNKLNRFGVRPLPKRQMILKLREIHQYTHQLVNSDSDDEAPCAGHTAQTKPPTSSKPVSSAQTLKFKEPIAPTVISPVKHNGDEEEAESLSASQDSNTSSTAASQESDRSNPELCVSSDGDSDSDGGVTASQAVTCLKDRIQAVRSFILSDSGLHSQILQYQPLVLSHLQQRLKAAGIRLGAAKLMDYLDSQCITFTTAKPGRSAPARRRGKRTSRGAKAAGASRKRAVTVVL